MTSSVLDIYNNALSAVHAKGAVTSITENSREQEVCSRWYELVRNVVQEAAYWPCCQATSRLAVKDTRGNTSWVDGNPPPQFLYSFHLPQDFLRARYLPGYQPFVIEYDFVTNERLLSTNVKNAVLVYTRSNDHVEQWTPGQQMATIYGLAAHIAGPLTGNNQLKAFNTRLANDILIQAQSNAANGQEFQIDVMPSVFSARGAAGFTAETRFFYPLGNVFSGANVDV